ncbi:MAG: DNA polymerase III subunit gamma/tau, partial [Gammaproteobacteria bacterium]|nr:DNA polymerase III subunit gamma/tau [Gammaproteobacteria bacterium]
KTLEEPPPHVKFLLATTDPQKLPATVLSRCLQFNLKRLTPALIRERLEHICRAESVDADPPALAMIARAADGSLRDALSLLDQAIAYCGGAVREEPVSVMLGTIDRQHVRRIVDLLADGDAAGLMATIAELDELFPDYSRLLDDLGRVLQQIAVFQVVGSAAGDDDIDEADLARLATKISAEDLQLYYQIAINGRRDLHLSPDPRSGAEMTLLRMLVFKPGGEADPAPARPAKAIARKSSVPVVTRKEPPSGEPARTVAEWRDPEWSELVPKLGLIAVNRQLAGNCAYLRREGNTLCFALDARSESYLTRERQDVMAAAISEYFGEQLKVDIAIGAAERETPVQVEKRREVEELDAARAGLEADPNVQVLKDMFGAELVADSVEPLAGR